MMLIIRNFKGAFENVLSGGGCSIKATAESVDLTMNTGRSMLNILVYFLLLFLAIWDRVVNATDVWKLLQLLSKTASVMSFQLSV